MDRILVQEVKYIEYGDVFNKNISEIIGVLKKYENDGWEGIKYTASWDSVTVYLYKHRLENDDEYNKRMNDIAKEKEKAIKEKEKRRILYEQLKDEFGS